MDGAFKKNGDASLGVVIWDDAGKVLLSASRVVTNISNAEEAEIMATAYAFVVNSDTKENMITALNAMKSGVPIIAVDNSSVNEIAGDAALYAANDIKDIGEKMMQLYKDENLRSALIKKGNEIVRNYTEEKSAAQLWRSITEALN